MLPALPANSTFIQQHLLSGATSLLQPDISSIPVAARFARGNLVYTASAGECQWGRSLLSDPSWHPNEDGEIRLVSVYGEDGGGVNVEVSHERERQLLGVGCNDWLGLFVCLVSAQMKGCRCAWDRRNLDLVDTREGKRRARLSKDGADLSEHIFVVDKEKKGLHKSPATESKLPLCIVAYYWR